MKTLLKKFLIGILTLEARLVLIKYDPGVIAVTGNVGKTSTKDAIARALSGVKDVRKSTKSYNSEIGIPLTILGVPNAWDNYWGWLKNIGRGLVLLVTRTDYPNWLVLEVGADHPGDIKKAARWLQADIAVITQIGETPVHVEYFDSPEAVAREKEHLLTTIRPGGIAILNADDRHVMAMKPPRWVRTITIGMNENAGVFAHNMAVTYTSDGKPKGIACKISFEGNLVPYAIDGAIGFQHFYAVLAAIAVGLSQEGNMIQIIESLRGFTIPPGRMRIIEGKNDSTMLDDTYNASPSATESALLALESINTPGRKIALLGDMKELGTYERQAHEKIGKIAARVCDELVVVGEAMAHAGEAAEKEGLITVYRFSDSTEAASQLADMPAPGDVILIKGSQSMRMERITEAFMAHPEQKGELLVRQEEQWQKR